MPLVSSAQNQEDIMLWRALRQVRDGFYIDVGAADPVALSVTRIFYEHGWRGINLEPNATYFAALSKARSRDINLPLGAGREAGRRTFHNVKDSGLSTFDAAIAARHRANGWTVTEQTVETLTLADICERYRPKGPIHFLKIDVEGAEGDVLAGADFRAFRPWIVLVEAMLPLSEEPSYDGWEYLLIGQGYRFVWFDGLNRFYISNEMKPVLEEHFSLPPNVFDDFVPASALLQRAEQAEQSLHQVNAQVAHMAEQLANLLQFAEHAALTASDMAEQLAKLDETNFALAQTLRENLAALAEAQQRVQAAQQRAQAAQQRAQSVEAQVTSLLASSSWRVTAPLRLARRGMRRLRSIALGPVEWLALRYRAYETRAAEQPPASPVSAEEAALPVTVEELGPRLAAGQMALLDLSEEETHLYRQLATRGLSPTLMREGPDPCRPSTAR